MKSTFYAVVNILTMTILSFFTKLAETGKNIFEMSDNEKFVYKMQLNCKELPIFVETIWNKRKLILESLS